MLEKDAFDLLPKWEAALENHTSTSYNAKIERIFVSFMDRELLKQEYPQIINGHQLPRLSTDTGKFTIVVALSGGLYCSVRQIVMQDNLVDLIQDAQVLDYIFPELEPIQNAD